MTLILNDVHIGIHRKGGTTPASREALRTYLHTSLSKTLKESTDSSLMILGDLFDDFEVDPRDWLAAYTILTEDWLSRGRSLILVAGNHDWSDKGTKVSSFELLATVLKDGHGASIVGINQVEKFGTDQWVIAHCSDQKTFDEKLDYVESKVKPGDLVFLHANWNNNFAAQSDHSLNVSREVGQRFQKAGATLVFAHEHQARTEMGDSVIVLGNQWPTSIADCLGNDAKFAHRIAYNNDIEQIQTWNRDGLHGYAEVDWHDLDDYVQGDEDFIRVNGHASAAEAADRVNAVAQFRGKLNAFVIANAVKTEGLIQTAELPDAFEATQKFDVLEFVARHLEPAEMDVVRSLAA